MLCWSISWLVLLLFLLQLLLLILLVLLLLLLLLLLEVADAWYKHSMVFVVLLCQLVCLDLELWSAQAQLCNYVSPVSPIFFYLMLSFKLLFTTILYQRLSTKRNFMFSVIKLPLFSASLFLLVAFSFFFLGNKWFKKKNWIFFFYLNWKKKIKKNLKEDRKKSWTTDLRQTAFVTITDATNFLFNDAVQLSLIWCSLFFLPNLTSFFFFFAFSFLCFFFLVEFLW